MRTDIPLMGDSEVKGWADSIIKNTHRIDLQILFDILEEEFEKERLDLIHSRNNKFCDKCDLSYPEHYDMCIKCHSTNLREYKIHNNMKELERNFPNNSLKKI